MQSYIQYIYFLPLVLMFIFIFYTSNKRKKEQLNLMNGLKAGDKIITIGGIMGTISKINEEVGSIEIKIDNNAKMTVTKSAIARKG